MTDYIVESHTGYISKASQHLNNKEYTRPGYELVSVSLSDTQGWIYVWRSLPEDPFDKPTGSLQIAVAAKNLMQASLAFQGATVEHQEASNKGKSGADALSELIINMTTAYNRLVNATSVMEAVLRAHG